MECHYVNRQLYKDHFMKYFTTWIFHRQMPNRKKKKTHTQKHVLGKWIEEIILVLVVQKPSLYNFVETNDWH